MATVDQLKARLEKLRAMRDSGVIRAQSELGEVQYRTMDELDRAISGLEGRISRAEGGRPIARILVSHSRGL